MQYFHHLSNKTEVANQHLKNHLETLLSGTHPTQLNGKIWEYT